MSANTVSSYCNSGNGDGDGGGRKDRRKKTDKKSALNPAASSASSHGEKASGGKRICIQDADGKIFFLQCPEGFAGGDGDESTVPLAAWVSSTSRKRTHSEEKKPTPPPPPPSSVDTASALMKISKSKSFPTAPPSSTEEQIVDRKPIQYETGYDPLTGEVKGPDIDPSELLGSGFCRNESSAVRDVNSTEDLNKAWFTTAKDKEALIDKGINWKQGAWSQEEVAILNENIKDYCSSRGIDDPAHVIFNMSKEERSDFYPTIAKGLQRPLFAVYRRVKRDYDVNNHKGVYTQAEVETLKILLKQFGPDWKLIGEKLGRSAQSVKDRCRQFKESSGGGNVINHSKWSAEEEKRLIMAVHEVGRPVAGGGDGSGGGSASTDEATWVVSAGKWRTVASLVKTRTEKQCRLKWSDVVKASISVGTGEADEIGATSSSLAPASAAAEATSTTGAAISKSNGVVSGATGVNGVITEWGSEEDAQLLSTLSKVMNNTHSIANDHSEFKTSRLEASDFVGALVGGEGGETILTLPAGSTTTATVVPSNSAHLTSIPSIIPSSSGPGHASAAAAVAATAGLVAPALHLPTAALQHHQLQHHVMPEGSYIWTHHPL